MFNGASTSCEEGRNEMEVMTGASAPVKGNRVGMSRTEMRAVIKATMVLFG
jgi:hypothetical protein